MRFFLRNNYFFDESYDEWIMRFKWVISHTHISHWTNTLPIFRVYSRVDWFTLPNTVPTSESSWVWIRLQSWVHTMPWFKPVVSCSFPPWKNPILNPYICFDLLFLRLFHMEIFTTWSTCNKYKRLVICCPRLICEMSWLKVRRSLEDII